MATRETEMHCHDCGNDFVAELDMDVNGNHEIDCPHCEHTHYRVVEDGRVTGERYRSSMGTVQANTYVTTGTNSSSSVYLTNSWNTSDSGTQTLRTSGST